MEEFWDSVSNSLLNFYSKNILIGTTLSGSIVSKCTDTFYNQKLAFSPQSEFTVRLVTTKELLFLKTTLNWHYLQA
jgi:hypothetical protein